MSFSFWGYCVGCHKYRLFIKHRKYKPSGPPYVPLTSEKELCGRCFKNVKRVLANSNKNAS